MTTDDSTTKTTTRSRSSSRLGYNIFFLYFDAIAYHLSMEYPRLVAKRNEAYAFMILLPLILLVELGNGILWKSSWMRVTPTLVMTGYLAYRFHRLVVTSLTRAKAWADNRLAANPSALEVISKGIQEERMFVEPGFFDLFVPRAVPPTSSSPSSPSVHTVKAGFILFPGALVEYRAYAGVAKKLSDQGILVVLFNTEHFHRLPLEIFECNFRNAKRAITLIEKKFNLQAQEWSVGGHSMGGFAAQQIVTKHPGLFRNIVLWATYRALMLDDESDVNVLVVQATRDGLGESFRKNPQRQEFLDSFAKLQGRKLLHDIEGGNHGGFCDCPPQTFPVPDKERTISLDTMHDELAKVTADFLLNSDKDQ